MTLRYGSTWLAGRVALFVLICLVLGSVAVTAHNRLGRVLRVNGVRGGQYTEQEP
jgi:hypothetical protein